MVADLADAAAAERFVEAVDAEYGTLDVLVNNVGGNRRKPFEETTDQDWSDIIELNVFTGFRVSRGAIPIMKRGGGGSIVFVSSCSVGRRVVRACRSTTRPRAPSSRRRASWHWSWPGAASGSTRSLPDPSASRVEAGTGGSRLDPEGMKTFVEANLPLGRFGRAEEVADVVTFLSSERASLITGACIPVDGSQGRSLI